MSAKPKTNRTGTQNKVSGYDVCQTPAYAVDAIIPFIESYRERNTLDWNEFTIWESAAGPEQLIVDTLEANHFDVIATDLADYNGFNFFEYEPATNTVHKSVSWDIQITNPPWSIKYDWIKRSCELGKPFALLVPYETTFAARFRKIFNEYHNNPYNFVVLSPNKRINFKMPDKGWGRLEWDEKEQKMVMRGNSAQMPTMWLTWGLVDIPWSQYLITKYINIDPVKYDENNEERQ